MPPPRQQLPFIAGRPAFRQWPLSILVLGLVVALFLLWRVAPPPVLAALAVTATPTPSSSLTLTPSDTPTSTLSAIEAELTIAAAVDALFTQTAQALSTDTMKTATADFEATVEIRFSQIQTATALLPQQETAAANGLDLLNKTNLDRIGQLGVSSLFYNVRNSSLSADGRYLAMVNGYENSVRLWDLSLNREINQLSALSQATATITPVVGTGTPYPTALPTLSGPLGMQSVAFSPGDSRDVVRLAAGNSLGRIYIWNAYTGEELNFLPGHAGIVFALAFSPDGAVLASASADGTIKLWAVATGRLLTTLVGHNSAVSALAFSPNGRVLASAGLGGRAVRLWNVSNLTPDERTSERLIALLEGHNAGVVSVAYSLDGRRLVAGGSDGLILAWDVANRESIRALSEAGKAPLFRLQAATSAIQYLAFNTDSSLLISAGTGNGANLVQFWDGFSGRELAILELPTTGIAGLAVSPDGAHLLIMGADQRLQTWGVRRQ
jgi:WD40 repeat protein